MFMGEAQPASQGNAFCSHLIQDAQRLGVHDVFTFAAMLIERNAHLCADPYERSQARVLRYF